MSKVRYMVADTFTLDDTVGRVSLVYPTSFTQSEFDDFKDWMAIVMRKIERSVDCHTTTKQGEE